MRCYLIHDDQIIVLSDTPASIPDGAILVESPTDLTSTRFPLSRLISIWNTLPGIEVVKRFKDRATAVRRLWAALEALPVSSRRSDSKQTKMLALLQRPAGASMADLIAATGWQRHSIRGVLSGVVRKKLGLALTSLQVDDVRIYRIGA